MTKHTEEALNAAEHINKRQAVVFGRDTWDVDELAGLIDRKTNLPELKRQLGKMREATRICLSWVKTVAGQNPNRMTREIIKTAQAALATAPPKSEGEGKVIT